jgi:hypothetical protein
MLESRAGVSGNRAVTNPIKSMGYKVINNSMGDYGGQKSPKTL